MPHDGAFLIFGTKKAEQNSANLAGVVGFEPTTFGFGDQRSTTELYSYT